MQRVVTVLLLATLPVTLTLKCYVTSDYAYTDSDGKPSKCDKSAKSCTSSFELTDTTDDNYLSGVERLVQSCSDEGCMLDGQEVNHALCSNTTDGHEECCCYGDGCNENYRMQHFLDKGILVRVPTTCKGFKTTEYKFGKVEYDKDPIGNVTDDDDAYDYSYDGAVLGHVKVISIYPDGTVARVVCNKGYETYIADEHDHVSTRTKRELNATCNGGAWTDDLGRFIKGRAKSMYEFLLCERDNADWTESVREDYFGAEHGDYGSYGDEGADSQEDSADNSTEPRFECYQGYKNLSLLVRDCKSCRSERHPREERVKLTCSDNPCQLNGKVVDTAVCYNASAEWDEYCCCYGDGCNENTQYAEFLAKGIDIKSPSTCVGFDEFSNGKMVYSEEPTGAVDFHEYYDGEDVPTYPNGTVARLICDKGYAAYRSTGVDGKEKQQDVYEKFVPTYTCDNGGWVGDWDDRKTLSVYESCAKESLLDGVLAEPPKTTEEDDSSEKLTLADSVGQRIERFYDKATHPEQVFLKRLFKHLATKIDS